jgi:hypothetical protein
LRHEGRARGESANRQSCTHKPALRAPMTLPSAFLMGETVSETSTKLPFLRWRIDS